MPEVTCTVSGLSELDQMLKELAPRAARNAIRRALKKGAAALQEAMEEKAPKETGFLSSHIGIGSKTAESENSDATASVVVSVGPEKPAFYALFREFGTKFQPAEPFMGPAFEENKEQILDIFVEELQRELERLKK